MDYNKAIELMNAGDDQAAADYFMALGDYKNSQEYLTEMCTNNPALKFYIADVGDVVTLGTYDHGDGIRGIVWYVLAKEDNRVLLMSKYIMDAMESSDIYAWIEKFNNEAFSIDEKKYSKAVLLDIYDADRYINALDEDVNMMVKTSPTARAKVNGIENIYCYYSREYRGYYWWLSGSSNGRENLVVRAENTDVPSPSGIVESASEETICGVRPFAWVELTK